MQGAVERQGRLSVGWQHPAPALQPEQPVSTFSAKRLVPPGFNPTTADIDVPKTKCAEARWLQPHEWSLLLESARTYAPARKDMSVTIGYPLLATFMLTGGRASEVLGLEVQDIDFNRRLVTFRPNQWRGLKTVTSHRSVSLWPQVESILKDYMRSGDVVRIGARLLFPATRTGKPAMLTDYRKLISAIATRAGFAKDITSKQFSRCAARLQTLDRGAPVSTYPVATELGHGGDSTTRKVYAHLGQVRARTEIVEYVPERAAQWITESDTRKDYQQRLRALRVVG